MTSTPERQPQNPATAGAASVALAADRTRGRLMAQSLGQLLDKARGAREVLPHLAALERALLAQGAGAVDRVPVHWLGRICSQLSSLPLQTQDIPLHDLLKCLRDKVQTQSNEWERDDMLSSERTVVIREISHSEFAAAEVEQAETMPMPMAQSRS